MPPNGRALPGMPLEMRDPDDEDLSSMDGRSGDGRRGKDKFSAPRGPWWRPASRVGRVLLGLGALLVLGGLTAGALALKTYLSRDARFRIAGAGNIEAVGLTEVRRAQMLPVFGEDIGRNIFFVPLGERRKQLEAIPWIERATVMRLLPDQIRVSVVERQPVAFVRQGQQIGLVDKEGVLLTMPAAMMAQHSYSFPVVTGVDAKETLAQRRMRMAIYGRLLGELDANGQHISEQLSEIDLTDAQDARVLMPEQGTDILAHFGDDRFLERYQRYKAHIAEWRQQYPKLAAVDLRYESQVVLEMTPGTDAVAAAVDGPGAPAATADAATAGKPSAAGIASAAAADTSASKAESNKPTASVSKPAASASAVNGAGKPAVVNQATVKPATVKPATLKQAAASKPKTSAKKAVKIEELAARQRAAHEHAAKAKAARAKAEKDKRRAADHDTALNESAPSSNRPAPAAAEGQ
ncbi:MAG: FtsQ-type POTRA domain-containing protein [Terracidiphilus sp.]|nr:FtsQ-type POTRA domain-containing protein [Terracidiphilus sp.]